MAPEISWSDEEWRERLSPLQYSVLRQSGTEAPWTGELLEEDRQGTYQCAGCGQELFAASTKFDSHCGWPSFFDAEPDTVRFLSDISLGYERTEVRCARCDSHLGHVFKDAPQTPTGLRYCMNSAALGFSPIDG